MARKQIKEYDILRVIVTFLVITGHCTYVAVATNRYGSWDYSAYTAPNISILYRLASYAVALIYTFHMQLYMMLSGALSRHTEKINGGGVTSFSDCKEIQKSFDSVFCGHAVLCCAA